MLFHVGPREYRCRVALGSELVKDGKALAGACDWARREILIADDVAPQLRMEVLGHELRHAWAHACPRPRTEEEEASFAALIMEAMYTDLERQGGREALEAMRLESEEPPAPIAAEPEEEELRYVADPFEPIGMVHAVESSADAHGGRAQCGVCGWIVAGGSIETSRPAWEPKFHGRVVHRRMYCPHCNHIQSWTEGVDPTTGAPNDDVADGPDYESDPHAVEAFLREHVEAAGMVIE